MEKLARIWVFWWALSTAVCAVIPVPDDGRASRVKPLVFSLTCLTLGTAFLAWRMGRHVPAWAGLAPISLGTGGMLLALLPNRRQAPWKSAAPKDRLHEDWTYLRAQPGNGIGLAVFAVLLLVFMVGSGFARHVHDLAFQARVFDPMLDQYRRALAEAQPSTVPIVPGKVLPISGNTGQVDLFLWEYLPTELRALSPDEVRLLLEIKEWKALIGTYIGNDDKGPGGGSAYEYRAKVRVVDRITGRLLDEHDFSGSSVPYQVTDSRDHEGGLVLRRDILRFLKELLKK